MMFRLWQEKYALNKVALEYPLPQKYHGRGAGVAGQFEIECAPYGGARFL
jgi:hypothetical protein